MNFVKGLPVLVDKKTIGIYLSSCSKHGGVFQYSQNILEALEQLSDKNLINLKIAYVNDEWSSILVNNKNASKLKFARIGIFFSTILHLFMIPAKFIQQYLSKINPLYHQMKNFNVDLWIYPAQDRFSYQMPFDCISTIHDLMYIYEYKLLEASFLRGYLRQHRFKNIASYSTGILVDSKLGKSHVIKAFNTNKNKIYELPFIPQKKIIFTKKTEINTLSNLKVPKNYIFYPAQMWIHKNHYNLIKASKNAFAKCEDFNLVLTGSYSHEYKNLIELTDKLNLNSHVHFVGRVNDLDLAVLFKNARATIFPTFFGPTNIPPLEAIQYGSPLAVSNIYAMPEQLGNAAIYFDPNSIMQISKSIELLWNNRELRSKLRNYGYIKSNRWTKTNFTNSLLDILKLID